MLNNGQIAKDLEQALEQAWSRDSAYPACQADYDERDPSWGNCLVSALVIWSVQGGDLLAGKVDMPDQKDLWHFRNDFPAGTVDVTWRQFDEGSVFKPVVPMQSAAFKEMIVGSFFEDDTLLPRLKVLLKNMKDKAGYDCGRSAEDIVARLRDRFSYVRAPSFGSATGPAIEPF